MADKQGKWVTINGRHVFIPKGKKLADVWDYGRGDNKEDNYEDDLNDNHEKARSLLDEIDDVTSEDERKSLEDKIRTALANEEITDEEETMLLNKLFDKDYESDLEEPNPMDEFSGPDQEGPSYAQLEAMDKAEKEKYANMKADMDKNADEMNKKLENINKGQVENQIDEILRKDGWSEKAIENLDKSGYDFLKNVLEDTGRLKIEKPDEKSNSGGIPQEPVDMPKYRKEGNHIVIDEGPYKGKRYDSELDYKNSIRHPNPEDLGTPEDFSKKTAKMPNGKEMTLFDFAHNIVNYLDTDTAATIIASKYGISEKDAKAYLNTPYNKEGSREDYQRKLESSYKK